MSENALVDLIRKTVASAGLCGFDSLDEPRQLLAQAANRITALEAERADIDCAYLKAEQENMALREALQRAAKAMERATLFITSKERIKHPEGDDWWEDGKAAARGALKQDERR